MSSFSIGDRVQVVEELEEEYELENDYIPLGGLTGIINDKVWVDPPEFSMDSGYYEYHILLEGIPNTLPFIAEELQLKNKKLIGVHRRNTFIKRGK